MIGDRGSRIRDGGSWNCRILVGLGDVSQTVDKFHRTYTVILRSGSH